MVDTGRNFAVRYNRKFPTRSAADDFIADLIGNKKPTPRRKQDSSIADIIRRYLNYAQKIQAKSPRTIRCDQSRLMIFQRWTDSRKIKSICDITIDQIRQFQEYYFDNAPFANNPHHRKPKGGPTAATWEKYRQILLVFFNWCVRRSLVEVNPVADPEFKIKTQQKIPEIFTPDELHLIFNYFDEYDKGQPFPVGFIFHLLAYTGMRLGEAINLRWSDVDLENHIIRIAKSKSKKIRSIPIHADLMERLENLPTCENDYVIDNGRNRPLYTDSWYWKTFNRAAKACDIKPRPIHSLRHTFAAHLVMSGVDIFTVKELLGHSDIKTTTVYLHFSPRHAEAAISKLPY